MAAHTGSSSRHAGFGATTRAILFKTIVESDYAPAPGESLKARQAQFAHRMFLIADEISMVGARQFSAMSHRAGEEKGARLNPGKYG